MMTYAPLNETIRERRRAYAEKASVPETSLIVITRVRLARAVLAGVVGALVFVVLNYATLFLVPAMELGSTRHWGGALFWNRFDLAQFIGSFFMPPYPTLTTWWLGIVLLFGLMAALGWVYALLLAWSLRVSTPMRGAGYGVGLFLVIGFTIGLANGIHPAVMRYAIPDTGFYFLGWTGWAAIQLLVVLIVYGLVIGAIYAPRRRYVDIPDR